MQSWLSNSLVAVCKQEQESYPSKAPFDPPQAFPEASRVSALDQLGARLDASNQVYTSVREALRLLGLDAEHYGTTLWNPLGQLVQPGYTVVLKPNLIRESHQHNDSWQQLITHGAVIRAVLDYVVLALEGRGRVVITDGPQTDSDFEAICHRLGLYEIVRAFASRPALSVELLDLRRDRWFSSGDVIYKREPLPGDPQGYTAVDLAENSAFASYQGSGKFYGADYDASETERFHSNGKHEYILSATALHADVFINLPKMKTHKKVGVTLSLKNLVGINGYRNCLPHHTTGTPQEAGDEFPTSSAKYRLEGVAVHTLNRTLAAFKRAGAWARWTKRLGKKVFGDTAQTIRSGNWYGNDTAWRMVLDLNTILFYFDASSQRRQKPLPYLTLVDGIVAGEGNGPMAADARPCGVIVAGMNPLAVDVACAHLMGFDYRKIPMLREAFAPRALPLADFGPEEIRSVSNDERFAGSIWDLSLRHFDFTPHFGWKGHIELDSKLDQRGDKLPSSNISSTILTDTL